MINVMGLQKKFKDYYAIKNVDMHVKKGEIYGFIGPNGSGKTTTMNIIAGLSRPTLGECTVNGRDVTKLIHPGDLNIGYLPEDPKFYPWMTAFETLDYLSGGRNSRHTGEMLKWTGLSASRDRRVGGFSRGMKQRLGIGAALIRNPELLILDEPSSALDPEGRKEILRLILDLKYMGKTILFSTHILDDVERICDTVGMIDAGQMLFEKPLAQLQKENAQPIFDITPVHPVESRILDTLEGMAGLLSLTKSEKSFAIRVATHGVSVSVMRFLADSGILIESFSLRKPRLEELFMQGVNLK